MTDLGNFDFFFKVVFVGEASVGKTNLISRYIHNNFILDHISTHGAEFEVKAFQPVGSDKKAQIYIWDTAGQEKYRALTSFYFKDAAGAILVYDISSYESFKSLDKWLEDIRTNADPNMIVLLVGNKSDMKEGRQVSEEEAAKYAESHGLAFMETSAKEGTNVKLAFERLFDRICISLMGNTELKPSHKEKGQTNNVKLGEGKKDEKKSGGCCKS